MRKQQLTRPEPATSSSIAKLLQLSHITASIHWSIPLLSTSVSVLYPQPPEIPHHLMINTRLLLLMTNEDGLRTKVMQTNDRLDNYIDLEVAGSGPVCCRFLIPSLSYHTCVVL